MPIPLIAVDIGNSRIKFGRFGDFVASDSELPNPIDTFDVETRALDLAPIGHWLAESPRNLHWWIGSVNRPATARLVDWLTSASAAANVIATAHVPLDVNVDEPHRVGIDRLLGAVAANRLRKHDYAAIIIDLGTAITVDFVDAGGAFRGGAILPGIGMAARAMHEQTDQLPRIGMSELDAPPPPLGRSTLQAIESGLFWGAVGAMKELIARLAAQSTAPCEVFVTGGAAASVAQLVHPQARHVPHLVLAGIALTAAAIPSS